MLRWLFISFHLWQYGFDIIISIWSWPNQTRAHLYYYKMSTFTRKGVENVLYVMCLWFSFEAVFVYNYIRVNLPDLFQWICPIVHFPDAIVRRSQGLFGSRTTNPPRSSALTKPKKTAMKALKMSIIHVVAFIVSWTPYTVMGTWSVTLNTV